MKIVPNKESLLSMLAEISEPEIFRPSKEELFRQGDRKTHVYIIAEGIIKIYMAPPNVIKETIVAQLGRGDVIGGFSGNDYWEYTAKPVLVSYVHVIRKDTFSEMIAKNHELLFELFMTCQKRNDAHYNHIALLGGKEARAKLATYLLDIQRNTASSLKVTGFPIPFSNKEMGMFLSLANETVCRILKEFERTGLIRMHGTRVKKVFTVLNPDALYDISEEMSEPETTIAVKRLANF